MIFLSDLINSYLNVFVVKTLLSHTIPKAIPNSVLCWLIYVTAYIVFNEKVTETATVYGNGRSSIFF